MESRALTKIVADRVHAERKSKGWSAERLAEEMRRVGFDWQRAVVAKLETGRRENVSVDELLALAFVLEVAPVHLLVPLDDDVQVSFVPTEMESAARVRAWVRGTEPVQSVDPRRYFSTVPISEWSSR